MMVITNIF